MQLLSLNSIFANFILPNTVSMVVFFTFMTKSMTPSFIELGSAHQSSADVSKSVTHLQEYQVNF